MIPYVSTRGSASSFDDDIGLEESTSGLAARLNERFSLLRRQIFTLKERIEGILRAKQEDIDWRTAGSAPEVFDFTVRRALRGHAADVYSLGWSSDNVTLASAAIDGKIILWDSLTSVKKGLICLPSPWIMTTSFEQTKNELLVAGGLDRTVSVFNVRNVLRAPVSLAVTPPARVLQGHSGYVTAARFLTPDVAVSASGDGTIALWSLFLNERLAIYDDHSVDVTGISVHPHDSSIFASSSSDGTLKLWDSRGKEKTACVMTFSGFESDALAVELFNNGTSIAGTGSDSTMRIFDLRTSQPIGVYTDRLLKKPAHSLALSKSGRLVFVAYESSTLVAWEVISSEGTFHELIGHEQRLAAVATNNSGEAVATTGYDRRVVIWA